jgi:RNA polymerase sigma-70 factor (ECF subfamily)
MTRPDLVDRARRGDREAFAEVAALEIDRLLATATLILREMHLAQDAVQETLILCWRQLPNLRDVATFDGWLYRSA